MKSTLKVIQKPEIKCPFFLWAFNFLVCFTFSRVDAPLTLLALTGLASAFILLRHKSAFRLSVGLWLAVTYLSAQDVQELTQVLLPCISFASAMLTIYFNKFPYVDSRRSFITRGERVEFNGKAVIRRDEEKWIADVESISTSGLCLRGDFDFKIGEVIDVEILEMRRFKSKAKVVGGTRPLIRLQFVGLNFGTVAQHVKVRQHVRDSVRVKAS